MRRRMLCVQIIIPRKFSYGGRKETGLQLGRTWGSKSGIFKMGRTKSAERSQGEKSLGMKKRTSFFDFIKQTFL